MRHHTLAVLFAAAVLLTGCSENDQPTLPDGPLMPLTPGNSWTYEQIDNDGETSRYTITVEPSREVRGQRYHPLRFAYDSGHTETENFARATDDGIELLYYLEDQGYAESNLFRFPVADGDTYNYTDVRGYALTYHVSRARIRTASGRHEALVYAGYDNGDLNTTIAFTPEVGVVRLEDPTSRTHLVSFNLQDQ